MKKTTPETSDHVLAEHHGILRVRPDLVNARMEIDFDPDRLSESEVMELVDEHSAQVAAVLEKSIFRLEGSACEACALKLERKVEKIPGVRRATATYLGKVLSVTFDSGFSRESSVFEQLRTTGADIRPLVASGETDSRSFRKKVAAGDLNEEISCGLGLLFLISALITEKSVGISMSTHILYLGAYIFAGQQGVRSALASLRERVLDVDVLMVLAALGAALIGAPFEGALLLFLFSFSNVLQRHAMERTQKAIESLLTLRPSKATVKRNGETTHVAVEDLEVGEIVIVRPGEQIPVDGVISEGSTNVDESSLTGESMPVSKTLGSSLFAGTLNQSGGIELTVTKRSEDSTLSRMVKLVAEAQAEKSTTQRFLEKAEQYYAMAVIGFTFVVFLIPFLSGETFAHAFYRAMTLMVVASPCALVISTPATVLSAIGGAARKGILIKGGSPLERAAQIDIVAIDKTGTLTFGKPTLTEIVTPDGIHSVDVSSPIAAINLLRVAAAVEGKSEHPLAHAIVKSAAALGITPAEEATDFQSTPGKGAEATVGTTRYLIGSERLFRELHARDIESLAEISKPLQAEGKTCVWLGTREGDAVTARALLVMADTIRPAARELTKQLHQLGVKKVVMLTGDQRLVAQAIATQAHVDEVHAELLPEDKLNIIRELKKEGTVMMIGDGVNDAPALAISDVGVAMGAAGTDVAMETADLVLMGDRLENIPLLLAHARRAKRVLLQNLIFASAVIVLLIISALGFALPLPLGVVGHEGSTVLVCLNGLRLLLMRQR